MRRRATFVHNPTDDFDPGDVQLKGRQLLHPGLKAAREERLTFGLGELPEDLVAVLQQSHELHVRWVSENAYDASTPFVSSLTPGLHVHSFAATFAQPSLVSERFASSASSQYHSVLPSLIHLVAYIQRDLCTQGDLGCFHTATLLNAADYVDFDYDSISHAMILTAFWSKPLPVYYEPTGSLTFLNQWPLDISSTRNDKVEVGIMTSSKATDPYELQLGGFLAVVGEDQEPKPTLFSFPSRHHRLSQAESRLQEYSASFQKPTGLHPILTISFPSGASLKPPTTKPEDSVCALHTYLTLPSSIFADEYAFPTSTSDSDPLFQQANNIMSLRAISGELDLEAPDYVVEKWGSALLIELATSASTPARGPSSGTWNATIPLHLRYQPPSTTGNVDIQVPWPIVFWACTAEDGTKFPINPFDRTNLGYDGLFGSRTMFYHLQPKSVSGRLVETIPVPVLNSEKVGGNQIIEIGTLLVVLLGFAWVLSRLWPGIRAQLSLNDSPRTYDQQNKEKYVESTMKKQQ
jgi:hypothetical protein